MGKDCLFGKVLQALPVGMATALSLALVLWFARLVNERIEAVGWTVLIIGLCAALAVLVYVLLRWLTGAMLDRAFEAGWEHLTAALGRFSGNAAQPVTQGDLRSVRDDLAGFVPALVRTARFIFAALLLMTVTLEVVGLANVAMMYLQTRRIEDQNRLLEAQNRVLDLDLLRESLAAAPELVARIREIRQVADSVNQRVDSRLRNVAFDLDSRFRIGFGQSFGFDPCAPFNSDDCGSLTLGDIADLLAEDWDVALIAADPRMAGYRRIGLIATRLQASFSVERGTVGTWSYQFSELGDAVLLTCLHPDLRFVWGDVMSLETIARGLAWTNSAPQSPPQGAAAPPDTIELPSVAFERMLLQLSGAGDGSQTDARSMGPSELGRVLSRAMNRISFRGTNAEQACRVLQDEAERVVRILGAERSTILARYEQPEP